VEETNCRRQRIYRRVAHFAVPILERGHERPESAGRLIPVLGGFSYKRKRAA